MGAEQVADFVQEQVELAMADEEDPGILRVVSYEEVGMLTRDVGFVIHTYSGHEFQVTVVRSR